MNRRVLFRIAGAASVVALIGACVPMSSDPDIVDIAAADDQFSTLVAAVTAAGLVDTLKGDGPFTVFAPTNAAFEALPAGTVEDLLKPENKDKLIAILTYHVVPGAVTSDQLAGQRMDVATVQGQTVHVDGRSGVKVNSSKVTTADIIASNGVIHVIDSVLLPK
ncbi:COG2335 Secreted and surface protein containing fasciclin-like repeats [Paracoccaceae bacterium]|jgi:uncharacterized surface protein with fasciclin (FAS1) repeats